jgi:drug/metabolite transporter (DMT)-like permease
MCIAFSGIFYRFADVEPSTATVFRCLYGLPFLALVAWLEQRRYGSLSRRTVALAVVAGALFAGDLTSWHHAIEYVGAGLATVLANLSVLVVGLIAWLALGERPSRSILVALPIVLLGVFLLSGLADTDAYGSNPALGVVLGVMTALFYGGYLLVIRRSGRDARRPAGPVSIATFSTAVVAGAAGIPLGDLNLAPAWPEHGWLFAYGVTSQFLGYLLISVSLPRLPAIVTSIILLAQPVATVALARLILDEQPSAAQLLGVVLVVGGIGVATVSVSRIRDRGTPRRSRNATKGARSPDPPTPDIPPPRARPE